MLRSLKFFAFLRMDSRDSNVQQNHPTLCRNGCGFYSNAGNEGLCSVCYKDIVKKKQAPPTNMPSSLGPAPGSMASLSIDESNLDISPSSGRSSSHMDATPPASLNTATPTVPVIPSNTQTDKSCEELEGAAACPSDGSQMDGPSKDDNGNKDAKKKKSRCLACKKKVGLTGFTCRCGGMFCSMHRYSDKHECSFDYKALGAQEISKSNPVVVAQKVSKI